MTQIGDFKISKHALQRALDMRLEPDEISNCLLRPISVEPCRTYEYREFTLYKGRRITCSVSPNNTVATILWATADGWAKDLKNKPSYSGREYRG